MIAPCGYECGKPCPACPDGPCVDTRQRIEQATEELIELLRPLDEGRRGERETIARNVCHEILEALDVDGLCGCRLCCS